VASLALISEQGVQTKNLPTCNIEKHVSGSAKLVIQRRISGGSSENRVAVWEKLAEDSISFILKAQIAMGI